jgi:hypothetical protein
MGIRELVEEIVPCLTLFCQFLYNKQFNEAMVKKTVVRVGQIFTNLGRHFLKDFQEVERKIQGLFELKMG